MLYSIIVPVYNVEDYLPKCIESVLEQEYKDFELILVNDGSTDKSGIICDSYAKKDDRIKVIHKENGGVSDARNIGIEVAKGDYFWFLDSDDFMAKFAMNYISDIIQNNYEIDMITCAHINEYNNGEKKTIYLPFKYTIANLNRNEFLFKLYESNGAYWAPWKNIYRRSVILNNNLRFLKGQIISEDCDFFMRFVLCAEKFLIFNKATVHYRAERERSISNVVSKQTIMGQLNIYKKYYDIFKEDIYYKNEKMRNFFANKFANTIYKLNYLSNPKDIDEIIVYIKENKDILKDTEGIKYNIAKFIWFLFDYYKGSRLLKRINFKSR